MTISILFKRVFIGVILITNIQPSSAQENRIDSLYQQLDSRKENLDKMKLRIQLFQELKESDYPKAVRTLSENFSIDGNSKRCNQMKGLSYMALAKANRTKSQEEYLINSLKAIQYLRLSGDIEKLIEASNMKALSKEALGQKDSVVFIYEENIKLAKYHKFEFQEYLTKANLARHYLFSNQAQIALPIFENVYNYFDKVKNYQFALKALIGQANCNSSREKYSTAGILFLDALHYSFDHSLKESENLELYYNLGFVYERLKDYPKAIKYLTKGKSLAQQMKHMPLLALTCGSLGTIFLHQENFKSAEENVIKAFNISKKIGLTKVLAEAHSVLAEIYIEKNQPILAKKHLEEVKIYNHILEDHTRISNKITLARYFNLIGDEKNALFQLKLAIKKTEDLHFHNLTEKAYLILADINNKFNKKDQAIFDFKRANIYKDSTYIQENQIRIADLETRYKTKEKEQQIKVLQLEDEKNQLTIAKTKQLNYAMMGGLSLFIMILIPSALYYKKRKESKLLIGKLIAREEESSDIAKDLHDSVASQLSYVHAFISKQGADENLVKLVKNVRDEVRTISHKLNINNLGKLSFKEALYDGLNLANQHPDLDIKIALSPLDLNINDENVKKNTIRIIQELLENTIKHAEASKVSLRVFEEDEKIILSYKDNGMGYDMDLVKEGHGLMNLKDRVKSISGKMQYHSAPNQGVKVNITV